MLQSAHMIDELRTAIGQMLIVGFHGTLPDDEGVRTVRAQIEEGLLGAVILFGYNIKSPAQVQELTYSLRQTAVDSPLLVCVDQEGGRVQRLSSSCGFSDFDAAARVAERMSVEEAEAYYRKIGDELASVGFTMNFAPCIDVDNEPPCSVIGGLNRSFSCDPQLVANYASAAVDGFRAAGVLSCVKHFPGHGSAAGDTHHGLVDVTQQWNEQELIPYRLLQQSGKIDAVMTAHVVHHGVAQGTPASLSPSWIRLLREDIGYLGVVIADDLFMGAIRQTWRHEDALTAAINAGNDMIILSNNPAAMRSVEGVAGAGFDPDMNLARNTIRTIEAAVQNGTIAEQTVFQAAERVARLKERVRR